MPTQKLKALTQTHGGARVTGVMGILLGILVILVGKFVGEPHGDLVMLVGIGILTGGGGLTMVPPKGQNNTLRVLLIPLLLLPLLFGACAPQGYVRAEAISDSLDAVIERHDLCLKTHKHGYEPEEVKIYLTSSRELKATIDLAKSTKDEE